jgi:hypothetical protein
MSNTKHFASYPALWLLPAIMLVVAILPLPYVYYSFLRIIICLSSGFIAYSMYSEAGNFGPWAVTFTLIAVLFNPIFPIFLSREIWLVVDLSIAGTYCAFGIVHLRKER